MRVHFREKYGTKGEEILYVTPAGKNLSPNTLEFIKNSKEVRPCCKIGIYRATLGDVNYNNKNYE